MTIRFRGNIAELRRARSFVLSLCIHGALVAFVMFGSGLPSEKPLSLYDQQIRPYEHKLIWYSLKSRVPDVRPTEAKSVPGPPRALRKFDQSLIVGVKDDAKAPQKVWIPDPPKVTEPCPRRKLEPLRRIYTAAVAPTPPQRPLRKFQPPPPQPVKLKPPPVDSRSSGGSR